MGQMAQKISKIDHDELLKALNEALSEEWLAYYQYWVGALVAKGPMRTSIVAEFMEHANEEYDHANKLGKRIIELGGTPVLDPKQWENLARCKYDARALRHRPLSANLRNDIRQRLRNIQSFGQNSQGRN